MTDHVEDRLSPFLDGELSPEDRAEVEVHLGACAECARRLAELAAVDETARHLPLDVPVGYFERFPIRVREHLESSPAPRRWRLPMWTWAVAAAVLVAVIAPLTLRQGQLSEPPSAKIKGDRIETEAESGRLGFERRSEVPPASVTVPVAPGKDEKTKRLRMQGSAEPSVRVDRSRDERKPTEQANLERLRALGYVSEPPTENEARPAPSPPVATPAAPQSRRDATVGRDRAAPAAVPEEAAKVTRQPSGTVVSKEAEAPARALHDAEGVTAGLAAEAPVPKQEKKISEGDLPKLLVRPTPRTVGEARELEAALRAWLRQHPQAPEADEVRVRIVETTARAFRISHDHRDLVAARHEAESYLAWSDARQRDRVRALLAALPPQP